MRGGENTGGGTRAPETKVGPEPGGASGQQKPTGLQQIQGAVNNLSELRRRKRANRTAGAGEEPLTNNSVRSHNNEPGRVGRRAEEGEWDASRLDEDKLAGKIGSSKAARMLGLTEDQVRQAVIDAKEELQQARSPSDRFPERETSDDGIGFSGLLSSALLLAGLGALWVYLSAYPHGTLSRFLVGVFPREMETLGLAT